MTGIRSQRLRTRSLPYPYLDYGLKFTVTDCRVDGSSIDFTPDHRVLPVFTNDNWERVSIHGTLTVKDEVVQTVFPEEERDEPPGDLYVAVRSLETIYRDRINVAQTPLRPGDYDVTVTLSFDQVRGDVQLVPFLVRGDKEGPDDVEHATTPGVRLASGKPWTVRVDQKDDDTEVQFMDGETKSFGEDPSLPSSDHLYYLDLRNPEQPKLWLNEDHQRITEVIHENGTMGAGARMRDVILDEIQYPVWTQLLMRTASDIDSETNQPKHEWQEVVLTMFGEDMYGVNDEEQVAKRIRSDVSDSEEIPYLLEKVDSALQKHIQPREQLINLIEEGLQI